MITVAAALVCFAQGRPQTNLPKFAQEMPIVGGQREIILGPKPIEFTLLNGYLEREIAARKIATPDNTGGYVDSWAPGGTHEENLGFFDCSTRPDNIFSKECVLITTNARWNQKMGRKPNEINWQNVAKQQWWVLPDGKILRHYAMFQTPDGVQSADCVYGADSIQRRYTDNKGKTSFGEVFPSCGMDALHAQFKPMVENGKVILRDKDFYVCNPLTGGLDKYSVHSAGTFKGEFLHATFKGKLFDIDGPNRTKQKVFLDDSGDLVKVALDDERYFVISSVPKTHLDEYGVPIRKSGGG